MSYAIESMFVIVGMEEKVVNVAIIVDSCFSFNQISTYLFSILLVSERLDKHYVRIQCAKY